MRVADRTTARNYLKYLSKAKSDYAATNERIASGKRFTQISDDVSSGSRVLQARNDRYKVAKQLENVKTINEELATTESAMTSIATILADIHSIKIEKANTGTTGGGREAIAEEIKAMQNEILQFANTQYSGKYVFGGTNATQAPFSVDKTTGELLYNGIKVDDIQKDTDGSYFYMDGTERKEIPMDGDVYMDIGLGIKMSGPNVDPTTGFLVSYSGLDFMGFGKDSEGLSNNIFNILNDVIKNIKDYDESELSTVDTKLVKLTDEFRTNLTNIGAKTHFLDTMEEKLDRNVDAYSIKIDNLMGTNDAEESTNQTMNDYVLKAVIQMGARILPVSLMDYLR